MSYVAKFSAPLLLALITLLGISLVVAPVSSAQVSISTGSIVGIVVDTNGGVVVGAKVTITDKGTGKALKTATNSSGEYTSGTLQPGDYTVKIEANGFKIFELTITVQVGNAANGNATLQVGQTTDIVEVSASTVAVNSEQATVQGVITAAQIDALPVNGRNFLDLAQLEPGVQIQEGSTFDPTKNGFTSISFEGRFGRTARIEIDGIDISDETVGTTTQNIPASAIEEFQLSQSSLDLSTELTSSGAVNVTTKSGTNDIHGQLFGLFRDNAIAAALPYSNTPPQFQREQFGGGVGGTFIKNKLFWFIDAERTKQDLGAAEPFSAPFENLNASLQEPFRAVDTDDRLDWVINGNARMFYRFNFDQSSQIRPYGSASSLQGFLNLNHTPTQVIGADFNTGSFTHSIRFDYLKFRNAIADGTSGIAAGPENPFPGIGIGIGAPVVGNCVISGGGAYCGGPNFLAPQQTFQSNHELKYDGSKPIRNHLLRYGAVFNHIQGGGLAAFVTYPQVGDDSTCLPGSTSTNCLTSANPLDYPINEALLGNGVGFSTTQKAFGLPGGGLGPDNRFEAYVGDVWKIRHNITISTGLRYVRDTGRVDSNLGPLPVLNDWGAGLGNRVRTPGDNFAPELGVAWDPFSTGKTVIRAGGGLFYENSIWNNVLFDSPSKLPAGIFSDTPQVCSGGSSTAFAWPTTLTPNSSVANGAGTADSTGTMVTPNFCGETISAGGAAVIALSNAFKSAAASVTGLQPNLNYIGTTLSAANLSGYDLFNPNYRTPRSWEVNIGFQRELRPGLVLSMDYIRNIGEHYLLVQDMNHSGAARSFNQANAIAARDKAQLANGCPAGPGEVNCMITALGQAGAQAAYSSAGLDSNIQATGGAPCSYCAFPGTNPVSGNSGTVGVLDMLNPVGRSVYNGLQIKLVQDVKSPLRGVRSANFQFSYSLSKFVSQVQDQDFVNLATNNDNPLQFTGPNGLDRTHQFSFGGTINLPWYTQVSLIGHFYSPLPQNLLLPELTSGGEIFATDWLGSGLNSGLAGEPVPGTQIGQFGRSTNAGNLQQVIDTYNSKYAGTLTPAGQAVVGAGVLTQADMTALGWVMPTLANVAPGALNFPWLKSFDLSTAWRIPVWREGRVKVIPSMGVFNLFNFHNAFLPGNLPLSSLLPGGPNNTLAGNVVGGVTSGANLTPFLASFQSGTYALGAPRQFEFGLKVEW